MIETKHKLILRTFQKQHINAIFTVSIYFTKDKFLEHKHSPIKTKNPYNQHNTQQSHSIQYMHVEQIYEIGTY